MDRHLTMWAHVSLVYRSAYCFLCLLRHVLQSVSFDAAKTVVHVFLLSHLDDCNSFLSGILFQQLQAVQYTAARLVTATRRCDHITPVLQQLHWLPVWQWVEFKLAVLVCKALNKRAPPCLLYDCQLVASCHRQAPSASIIRQFQVHYHWYQFTSWRSSTHCCWTTPLEQSSYMSVVNLSLDTFCHKLKTYLKVQGTSASDFCF